MKKEKFTITGLIFTMTGCFVIAPNATFEYKEQVKREIRDGLIYKYITSDIPENIKVEMTSKYDDGTLDYDPVIKKFLCSNNAQLARINYILKSANISNKNGVIKNNIMIAIPKIDLDSYKKYSKHAISCKEYKDMRKIKIITQKQKKTCTRYKNMI